MRFDVVQRVSRLNARASLPDKRVVEMLLALNVVEGVAPTVELDGQWNVQRGQRVLETSDCLLRRPQQCFRRLCIDPGYSRLYYLFVGPQLPTDVHTMRMAHFGERRERGVYWYVLLTVFDVDGLCVRVKLFCALNQTLRCRTVVPPLDEITKYVPMRLWLA